MTILITLTIALLITFIGARVTSRFKYPPILGQFLANIVLAIPIIKNNLFTLESVEAITTFAELSIIFLLIKDFLLFFG